MKSAFYLGAAALLLSACGGADDEPATKTSELRADCDILASDPEAQETFDETGITADTFCGCFEKVVASRTETEQAQMKLTLSRVTTAMEENGQGAEDVVGNMMGSLMMAAEEDTEAQDLTAGISLIGDAINDIGNSYEDGNSCPAG